MITPEAKPALLRLPAELRNRIYHEVLVGDEEAFELTPEHFEPPVLNTCRQLREECIGIFYSNHIFQFNDPNVCLRWLLSISPQHRELIREIRYDCSETCEDPTAWLRAFTELPGLDETTKLAKLKRRLSDRGVSLREEVLQVGVRIGNRLVWTTNPLFEVKKAVEKGSWIDRMFFV